MSSCSLMHRVYPPSKPPDGGYPPSFRPIVGGTQLRGSWYLSAIVRLQGFSSASPAVPPPPRRRSPKTVTTSSWVGRSKPGCDLGPTLSFKDVHHPRWGRGRAEPALYLPRGFVGHPLPRRSRERALTGGPPKMPHAARAAFVFWGGPAFAPGWRPPAEDGAPLVREDLSGDLPGG
jgi:hypothetical protein